jgi:ubiquinone/menaquinone biosynthesis C-methylase UbiE
MLNQARRRAGAESVDNSPFLAADAQRHRFAAASYAAIVSRFGVTFFDDPEAAFATIGNAIRPGGALTCLAQRSREEILS